MERHHYLHDPIVPIDLNKVDSLAEVIKSFAATSFQSRNLAKCLAVFEKMIQDEEAIIFFGLSGAMIPGGMRKVIRDMIEERIVDVIVSTGANVYHDFYEGLGFRHYIGSPHVDDTELHDLKIDRVYDTYADDAEFLKIDQDLAEIVERELEPREYSTRELLHFLGSKLSDEESIVYTAYKRGIPIFVPALNDSSFGISLTHHYHKNRHKSPRFSLNPIRDNYEIAQIKLHAKDSGAFYVGGGVPKNYIQQVEPMIEVMGGPLSGGHKYAFQITTDDPKWGGLSGCTLEESQSWGKLTHEAEMATVYLDATIGLPLLVGALKQSCKDALTKRKRRVFHWDGDTLAKIEYRD